MVGVAVIGCGKIAQIRHIPEYFENEDVRLIGLFDNNLPRAEELAARYGCCAYKSLDQLLSDDSVDAVSVCVANNAHAEVSIKALRAGKHVLCEKPMAVTIEECEEMVRTADECGLKLMIAQNQRYAVAHMKARELVENGIIGKVLTFRTTFGHAGPEKWSIDPGNSTWFFDKKKAAMGVMADLGIHKTDLIQYILGTKIVSVTATLRTLDKRGPDGELIGVDDNAVCIYEMNDKSIGTMTASWTYCGADDDSTQLYGTEGNMYINEIDRPSIVIRKGSNEEVIEVETGQNLQTNSGIVDAFVDSIVSDTEPPVSGRDVLASMRAVFAAIRSSETGTRIEIPENRN